MGMALLNYAADELQRVLGLRPFHLAAGNLPKAIDCLLQQVRAVGGPEVEFYHDVEPERLRHGWKSLCTASCKSLSPMFAVTSETYEGPGSIEDDEFLCVQMQKWGIGFEQANIPPMHSGLKGIRRRAQLLGGITTILSEPGQGTFITVELPLTA